jgi:hypothetical protein
VPTVHNAAPPRFSHLYRFVLGSEFAVTTAIEANAEASQAEDR